MRRLALGVAVLAFASAAAVTAAHPGRNGRIAFELGDRELFTVSPDGSGLRRFRVNARDPAYAPDGSALAYVASDGAIVIAPTARGRSRRLVRFGDWPAWSPNGSRIAYVRGSNELVIADLAGRARIAFRLPELYEIAWPEWSPDGRWIVVGASANGRHDLCCIYLVRPNGTRLRALIREPLGAQAVQPHWSGDGKQVAFTAIENCRASACSGPAAAHVVRADGSQRRLVAADAHAGPWSPDGRYLLLERHDEDGPRLDVYRVSTGAVTTLRRGFSSPQTSLNGADWQPRCTRSGDRGGDVLRASRTGDVVCGRAGDDVLAGGPQVDRLFGGAGADEIDARRGGFDVVGCGPGRDVVRADRSDLVGDDCERVTRRR